MSKIYQVIDFPHPIFVPKYLIQSQLSEHNSFSVLQSVVKKAHGDKLKGIPILFS